MCKLKYIYSLNNFLEKNSKFKKFFFFYLKDVLIMFLIVFKFYRMTFIDTLLHSSKNFGVCKVLN